MIIPDFKIIPYRGFHQPGVDEMMKIISEEFTEPIFSSSSIKMQIANRIRNHHFWVAMADKKVIGSVGIILLKNHNAALKSMFLLKNVRSNSAQIANALLQVVISYAIKYKAKSLYLGTMDQFKAAQRFYEKNGFIKTVSTELPADFGANVLDTLFYKRRL